MYAGYVLWVSSSFFSSCCAGFPVDAGKSSSRSGGRDISSFAFSATSASVTRPCFTIDGSSDVSDRN